MTGEGGPPRTLLPSKWLPTRVPTASAGASAADATALGAPQNDLLNETIGNSLALNTLALPGARYLNHIRRQDDFLNAVRGLKHADVIRAAVRAKKNILVVGSTGSGKTTFVNACLDALATLAPTDRVISIEDTTELQCPVQNYLDLRAVGNVTMLHCLRACMRLKPTRIIVGEVRGAEAHTLLKAWNTGHPGGMATVHANDAMSGLIRLESLVAEATTAPQQALIAEAVDLVIFIDEEPELAAGRKVRELLLVTGYADGQYQVEHV